MIVREVREEGKEQYNLVVSHPLQSWEWGEFRKSMGSEVVRLAAFDGGKLVSGYQLYSTTFPYTDKTVWLMLRGPMPDGPMLEAVKNWVARRNAIFVKIEPDVAHIVGGVVDSDNPIEKFLLSNGCVVGKPFFASHSFWINLSKSSEELLASMKEKTRYNVRLAQKHGVVIEDQSNDEAFEKHLDLMLGTADRQGFKAHDREYHRKMWNLLSKSKDPKAYLLVAKYNEKILASWVLFKFHDTLYYPYGASSLENREVMASHAMMWAAIELGKNLKCKRFDLWGAAAPGYSSNDPWSGFTKFKEGFGGDWMSYVGSFDLVIDTTWYKIYRAAEKLRAMGRKFHLV